ARAQAVDARKPARARMATGAAVRAVALQIDALARALHPARADTFSPAAAVADVGAGLAAAARGSADQKAAAPVGPLLASAGRALRERSAATAVRRATAAAGLRPAAFSAVEHVAAAVGRRAAVLPRRAQGGRHAAVAGVVGAAGAGVARPAAQQRAAAIGDLSALEPRVAGRA